MYVLSADLGLSHPSLSPASVPLPPEPKGGGHPRLRVRGWGIPNSDDWRKSLALCLLCGATNRQIWDDSVFCTATCKIFIEPPPDTHRTERQGERGIWVAMGCYLHSVTFLPFHRYIGTYFFFVNCHKLTDHATHTKWEV